MPSMFSTCAALSVAAIAGYTASASNDPSMIDPVNPSLQAGSPAAAVSAGNLPGTAAPDRDVAAIAALRARGEAGLAAILREHDVAPVTARAALAATVDAVAAQRYATVSRLYWHTDLPAAQAEARRTGKPILALRMLGRLDEDLSCANSRFFRTALYPNRQVADLLREQFVLLWTSERQVPRVTIDYGDGRALVSTVTGNSIHYVLDADGRVLDALPGLYAPAVFAAELEAASAVAAELRTLPPEAVAPRLARYLDAKHSSIWKAFERSAEAVVDPRLRRLFGQGEALSSLSRAQRATVGKAIVEVPMLTKIAAGADPGTIDAGDVARWASVGQAMFRIGEVHLEAPEASGRRLERARRAAAQQQPESPELEEGRMGKMSNRDDAAVDQPPKLPTVLDARARKLVAAVYATELPGLTRPARTYPTPVVAGAVTPAAAAAAAAAATDALLARFEQRMVADSALNQVQLRPLILAILSAAPGRSLEELNRFIYDSVFATPSGDAWLGLLPRDEYTGLPGDGALVH